MIAARTIIGLRPPRIAMTLTALALAVDAATALPRFAGSPWTGALVGLGGFAIMLRAWWLFRLAGTPVCPTERPTTLITGDVFAASRNPMYLGMVLMIAGVGIGLGAPAVLAAAVLQLLILDRVFCPFEEARLQGIYGVEYRDYRQRVRRWI
jgi:protein-S-isoprenylcysteine O-methyltransferase Ste14